MKRGKLLVISGRSAGCGKSTVIGKMDGLGGRMWSSPYPPQRAARAPERGRASITFSFPESALRKCSGIDELLEHAEFVGGIA